MTGPLQQRMPQLTATLNSSSMLMESSDLRQLPASIHSQPWLYVILPRSLQALALCQVF